MTTPLAVSIKQAFPAATVDYLVFAGTGDLLLSNPWIDRVISIPPRGNSISMLLPLLRRYDVALAANPSDRTVIAAALCGRFSVGLTYGGGKQFWRRLALSQVLRCDNRLHVVEHVLSLLGPLGIVPVPKVEVHVRPEDKESSGKYVPSVPYVVFHPYSRAVNKYWPTSSWAELAALILDRTDCVAVFTTTPAPGDAALLQEILSKAPARVRTIPVCTLQTLAAVIQGSSAYVGIDTAITHVAAAVGVPAIAIFGPSYTRYWAPWPNGAPGPSPYLDNRGVQRRGNVTVVQKDWECVPCNKNTCAITTRDRIECLEAITPEEVFREVEANLPPVAKK